MLLRGWLPDKLSVLGLLVIVQVRAQDTSPGNVPKPRDIQNIRSEPVYIGQVYSARSDRLLMHFLYSPEHRDELTDVVYNSWGKTTYSTNNNLLDR